MIVLFEGHSYSVEKLSPILDNQYFVQTSLEKCRLTRIGYIAKANSQSGGDTITIVILPKVFLDDRGQVLGNYLPEDFLDLDTNDALRRRLIEEGKLAFLFKFSVWLYLSIKQFGKRHKNSSLIESGGIQEVSMPGKASLSALEIANSLLQFYRDNLNILTFIKRFNASQNRKISWRKTVSKIQPLIIDKVPYYGQYVVKDKHVNYDEELLRIFISTLSNLDKEFGFGISINPIHQGLTPIEYKQFLKAPIRRLKQIRSNYFSDKLIHIWHLLFLYYEQKEHMKTHRSHLAQLLVGNFDIVFEDMVDMLLSDPKEQIPEILKDQRDGKKIDHIYEYKSLIQPDSIYHIGDSKYYQRGASIDGYSVYKQYTYARNVVFANIDRMNKGILPDPLRYRDDLTEGYNPTPNFFISAFINDTLDFKQDELRFRNSYSPSYHFKNRLFDRDTLLLQRYDINFLFVLASYVTKDNSKINNFRLEARNKFRLKFIDYLNQHYLFFKVNPLSTLSEFTETNFKRLIGQIYRPAGFSDSILMALPKGDPMNEEIISQVESQAKVESWTLS